VDKALKDYRILIFKERNEAMGKKPGNKNTGKNKKTTHAFQAEVGRLMKLMIHSLYSDRRIFLRELISNASDACDRLRLAALTEPALLTDDTDFRITVEVDEKAKTIEVSDNGIGMNEDALARDLGTIAGSGTAAFLEQLSGDTKKDAALIGEFGVGFYAAFMVADRIEVHSRRAGEAGGWLWSSKGAGKYSIEPREKAERGTCVRLHLRADAQEFADPVQLRGIVATYSDHIGIPIYLRNGENEDRVNEASALWTRPKSEITKEQYQEFYHHVAHAFDEPWLTLHARAEGRIEYTNLLFVPSHAPLDLFDPERRHSVKLYVKRVFITDNCEGLIPRYLRFLRGVVDTEDLPLNVSREILQNNPLLAQIRAGITKKVLAELARRASKDAAAYEGFWSNFGAVLKEGLYEDPDRREALFKVARFRSTASEGLTSLKDYVARMKEGQEAIYYLTGDDLEALRHSPLLEGFAAKGVEVLLLTDPVDPFWVSAVPDYDGKPLRPVNQGVADLSGVAASDEGKDKEKTEEPRSADPQVEQLIVRLKLALGDDVGDVRASHRLTESAVCLVSDEGAMDPQLARILRQHGGQAAPNQRILEVNPEHPLILRLAGLQRDAESETHIDEAARLLFDQARIAEGELPRDPAAFAKRLSSVLERSIAPDS
jgi:molecular chaperone HtpG